jgi:hypothetical protein
LAGGRRGAYGTVRRDRARVASQPFGGVRPGRDRRLGAAQQRRLEVLRPIRAGAPGVGVRGVGTDEGARARLRNLGFTALDLFTETTNPGAHARAMVRGWPGRGRMTGKPKLWYGSPAHSALSRHVNEDPGRAQEGARICRRSLGSAVFAAVDLCLSVASCSSSLPARSCSCWCSVAGSGSRERRAESAEGTPVGMQRSASTAE